MKWFCAVPILKVCFDCFDCICQELNQCCVAVEQRYSHVLETLTVNSFHVKLASVTQNVTFSSNWQRIKLIRVLNGFEVQYKYWGFVALTL